MREILPRTPLLELPELSDLLGRPTYAKLESLQVTGSFKVRGAVARMLALSPAERARGVVTCSSGNHGRAVAWVSSRLGCPAVICLPDWVDPVKLEAIRDLGADVVMAGDTYDEAAEAAAQLARERALQYVHPFDDLEVAAGQATVALEILESVPDPGAVVVPLSGGGLVGGMAYALTERSPSTHVVAVSARRAAVMLRSLEEGRPVSLPEEPTLAHALSGGIELDNRVSFALVRDHVDQHAVVEEKAIAAAMLWAYHRGMVVEGGGAVGLAAILGGHAEVTDGVGPVVVIVSGGNVSLPTLASLEAGAG